MNQDKHLFQFSGQRIAAACGEEVGYRKERITFWEKEQQKQVKRAKGLKATAEVREWQHTGGKGYEVIAVLTDIQDINTRLRMCGEKLQTHRQALSEYELKGAAYHTQPGRIYELDPSDVAYFKLNGAKRSD